MQAKISIQLIAPHKAIKPSRDLKYVFDSANFRLGHSCPALCAGLQNQKNSTEECRSVWSELMPKNL